MRAFLFSDLNMSQFYENFDTANPNMKLKANISQICEKNRRCISDSWYAHCKSFLQPRYSKIQNIYSFVREHFPSYLSKKNFASAYNTYCRKFAKCWHCKLRDVFPFVNTFRILLPIYKTHYARTKTVSKKNTTN